MVSVKNIKAFVKANNVKSILQTKKPEIHGINPTIINPRNGKTFELSRFDSVEVIQAKIMNNFVKQDSYKRLANKTSFPKATSEDAQRLTSMTLEDSYKRAVWINPKDGKGYYLLDEGLTQDKKQKLRILNSDGEFIKNAEVQPKTVVIADLLAANYKIIIDAKKNGALNHTDIANIVARRYNPFAKYKTVQTEKTNTFDTFKKIAERVDNNTACISSSYGEVAPLNLFNKPLADKMKFYKELFDTSFQTKDPKATQQLDNILKRTRMLYSAGNDGNGYVNTILAHNGIEGVGGLDKNGQISKHSSSADKLFTQHYEQYSFLVTLTDGGVNITGLRGTDYPLRHKKAPEGLEIQIISGTSFSAPIRAAKIALNDMMQGVL